MRKLFLALALLCACSLSATDFYISPTGNDANSGDFTHPWGPTDAKAKNPPASVHADDTIWIRAGTYTDGTSGFSRNWNACSSTVGHPVIVRAYIPNLGTGNTLPERATINGDNGTDVINGTSFGTPTMAIGGLSATCGNVRYMDLEVTQAGSAINRITTQTGQNPKDIPYGTSINTRNNQGYNHPGIEIVACIIHDTTQGLAPQNPISVPDNATPFTGDENIIFYNGWDAIGERGHGHGFYVQGRPGNSVFFRRNITMFNASMGYQDYGSSDAYYDNQTITDNIFYGNSDIPEVGGGGREVIIGGYNPPTNMNLNNNIFYTTGNHDSVQIGWQSWVGAGSSCGTPCPGPLGNFNNNLGVGRLTLLNMVVPDALTITGGTWIYAGSADLVGLTPAQYAGSTWTSVTPVTNYAGATVIKINPSAYVPGRGSVTIYNPTLASTVAVDLSTILTSGDTYQIQHNLDYYGPAVLTGTYAGGTVNFPMTGLNIVKPAGNWSKPTAYSPRFASFTVFRTSSGATPTPTNTASQTPTNTNTPSNTPTRTPTNTPSASPTPTYTQAVANTATFTPSNTPTVTPTPAVGALSFSVSICTATAPMTKHVDATVLGGTYASSTTVNSGKLACPFTVPITGTYRMWVIVNNSPDGNQSGSADSMFEDLDGDTLPNGMNDGDTTNLHIFDMGERQQPCSPDGSGIPVCDYHGAWAPTYGWQILNDRSGTCGSCTREGTERQLFLTSGTQHTFSFRGREISSGESGRLAYIILTTDMNYNPGNIGQPTVTPTPGMCSIWVVCNHKQGWLSVPCSLAGGNYTKPCVWR